MTQVEVLGERHTNRSVVSRHPGAQDSRRPTGSAMRMVDRFRAWCAVNPRQAALLAALAALTWALAFQGARDLWEPDEGRYTAVALEMLRSGDWMTPRLHPDVPHFTKPPLTYWTIAAAFEGLGETELAARLPGALAFTATILLVFAIARRLGEARPGLAAVIYATSLLPFVASNVVSTDTQLALWEAVAGLGFVGSVTAPDEQGRQRWLLLMWSGFGAAFLTKGPPGLLPLAAFVTFVAATRGLRGVRRLASAPGLALFAVIGLGWYAVSIVQRPDLLHYLLVDELAGRFTGTHHRNPEWYKAFEVYLPVLLGGALPWILGVRRVRGAFRLARRSTWARWRREDPAALLLGLWVLLPLAIFMVASSRMPLYLLPLFLPLSLVLARALPRPLPHPRRVAALLALWAALLLGLRATAARVETDRHANALAATIRSAAPGPVNEVVVVNDVNWYGLSFYLGCEVEQVALDWSDLGPRRPETLIHELHHHPENQVFLVPRADETHFVNDIGCCGRTTRRIGQWRKFALYWSALGGAPPPPPTPREGPPPPS